MVKIKRWVLLKTALKWRVLFRSECSIELSVVLQDLLSFLKKSRDLNTKRLSISVLGMELHDVIKFSKLMERKLLFRFLREHLELTTNTQLYNLQERVPLVRV